MEEGSLCLVLTNAVEVKDNSGWNLDIAVYESSFCWINHSCSPKFCEICRDLRCVIRFSGTLLLAFLLGSAVNYIAISEALGVTPSVMAAGVAIDNVLLWILNQIPKASLLCYSLQQLLLYPGFDAGQLITQQQMW